MDAEVLQGLIDAKEPEKKAKEVKIKLVARLGASWEPWIYCTGGATGKIKRKT